jgi:pimeloyl-ACP methyl ester carboxylesterase
MTPEALSDDAIERATKSIAVGTERFPVLDLGTGPPVLLLHGFPDSRRLWRHQVPALVAAGLRAIAPDLRGFGDAPAPLEVEPYRMRNLIADVVSMLRALAVPRVRLVGHDWGASLAWSIATYVPGLVERLAVLSVGAPGASGWHSIEQRRASWYFYFFQFAGTAEAWLTHDDWRLMREWVASAPDGERSLAQLARPGRLTAGINWYRANVAPKPPSASVHPKVGVPVLGLWGERDAYLTEAQMTTSDACVSASWRYERIANAGHWLMLEQSARVNALLVEFLR